MTDAARLKVEKILTDLYSWNAGTYQFATKSLPKTAIDLELSTAHVILNSMRRIQDRQWVLNKLGSLETVLAPGLRFESVLAEASTDTKTAEVVRLADGTRTVRDIAANVAFPEFEVCKTLSAALALGALEKQSVSTGTPAGAPTDAFDIAIQSEDPSLDATSLNPTEVFEIPSSSAPAEVDVQSDTTVFNADPVPSSLPSHEEPRPALREDANADIPTTTFDFNAPTESPGGSDAPDLPGSLPSSFGTDEESPMSSEPPPSFEALNIHEPEPEEEQEDIFISGDPEPGSGLVGKLVRVGLALVALAGLGAASYFFVWPTFFDTGTEPTTPIVEPPSKTAGQTAGGESTPTTTAAPSGTESPDGDVAAAGSVEQSTSPEQTATRPTPQPLSTSTSTAPLRPTPSGTANADDSGATGGGSNASTPGGTNARALLDSGNLRQAARAFRNELASSSNSFTIAVGLYCDEQNAARTVQTARGANQLYLLPVQINGRACYRVLWGLFDTRESARAGIASVPSGIPFGRLDTGTRVPVSALTHHDFSSRPSAER